MVAESIKVFLDGQFWLDPEVFGPDEVAFARRMDVEHVNYRSWKRETKRDVVADSDKHVIRVSIFYVSPLEVQQSSFHPLKTINIHINSERRLPGSIFLVPKAAVNVEGFESV